ncbi:globin [Hyphomonas sp. FCG-A18]|uniref:globin n=1 Tax=Hyphomonas sp. FCG-A18 TaxID=3080019 RepID=UPI002B316CC8|nr:globin [Hyphomonas sp. FCG-A18]
MSHHDAFTASLESVAAKCEDVVPPVYAALFQRFPEMEDLFVLDTDDGAKGHMLNEALTQAEGLLTGDAIAPNFLAAERMNHVGYGIDEAMFTAFFEVMQDVFARLAGADWTPAMTKAWEQVIASAAATAGPERGDEKSVTLLS